MSKRKAGALGSGAGPKLDSAYPGKGKVYGANGEWFDAMLNQTNVGANNNKYYIIQLVEDGGSYACWTHWGRVGEPGQSSKDVGPSLEKAKKQFMKKFKDKTRNDWDKRANFKFAAGKYALIEMDHAKSGGAAPAKKAKGNDSKSSKACTLPKPLHETVKLIFSTDMFKDSMKEMGIDVDKMPLGNLSQAQVQKGRKALEDVEKAIEAKKNAKLLGELSSKYYTAIPHIFGRKAPPAISDETLLGKEFDLMNTLADISTGAAVVAAGSGNHPDDVKYRSTNCSLKPVATASKDFKAISKYFTSTAAKGRKLKILDVFEMDRKGEGAKFKAHSKLKNRKLLWHGTSVAVVVAILKSGLRIMPHARGRVGRGLYFASENGKSSGYVGTTGKHAGRWGGAPGIGFMFLVEVALGKEKEVDGTKATHPSALRRLKSAPKGFDCVVARGRQEPDPKADTTMKFEGNDVVVPQGKPKVTKWAKNTCFHQSEYLVYKESQARIRYMLKLKFG